MWLPDSNKNNTITWQGCHINNTPRVLYKDSKRERKKRERERKEREKKRERGKKREREEKKRERDFKYWERETLNIY